MKNVTTSAAVKYNLATIKKALAVCIALKKPAVIWGPAGFGKTAMIQQLAAEMGAELFVALLSVLEPTDVGGHPYPVQVNGRTILDWIQSENSIPFITPERADLLSILFFDELDRCPAQTQNSAMNLVRERQINGRRLVPSCAVICAANGSSDTHTSPISEAFATRCIHFYVETSTPAAQGAWDAWAEKSGLDPWVRGFSKYRQNIVCGAERQFTELQRPNPRTVCDAFECLNFCDQVSWGSQVAEPLAFGSVGQLVGREMIAFKRLFASCPPPEAIKQDPKGSPVPADIGVLWAVGRYLIDHAADAQAADQLAIAKAFATYVARWPDEPRADWYRSASAKLSTLVSTDEWKKWEKTFRKQDGGAS